MKDIKLLTLKRQSRSVVVEIESDVRFTLETWLKDNLIPSSEMTETDYIADMIEQPQLSRETLKKFINFYGFWNLEEPVILGDKVLWKVKLKEQVNNADENLETQKEVSSEQEPSLPTEDNNVSEVVESQKVVIPDTISKSKKNRGKWMGLRRWLTVNGFNKSEEQRLTLEQIMNYYRADKGSTSNITYEFLRDRLLFDGFVEQNGDVPIKQRIFDVSKPKISLQKKLEKKQGKLDE